MVGRRQGNAIDVVQPESRSRVLRHGASEVWVPCKVPIKGSTSKDWRCQGLVAQGLDSGGAYKVLAGGEAMDLAVSILVRPGIGKVPGGCDVPDLYTGVVAGCGRPVDASGDCQRGAASGLDLHQLFACRIEAQGQGVRGQRRESGGRGYGDSAGAGCDAGRQGRRRSY